MNDDAIDMRDARAKLRNLRGHMPGEESVVYDFAAALGERLNEELYPEGFAMTVILLMVDLRRGVSGVGAPLPLRLLGYQPSMYAALSLLVPRIVRAAFADGDADRILAAMKEAEAA